MYCANDIPIGIKREGRRDAKTQSFICLFLCVSAISALAVVNLNHGTEFQLLCAYRLIADTLEDDDLNRVSKGCYHLPYIFSCRR